MRIKAGLQVIKRHGCTCSGCFMQDQHAVASSSLLEQAERMHREFEEYQAVKNQEIAALDKRVRELIQGGAAMPAAEATKAQPRASNLTRTRQLRAGISSTRKGLRLVREAGRVAKKSRTGHRTVTPESESATRTSTPSSERSAIKASPACAANCEVCLQPFSSVAL
jgi:hypothetical protein